MKLKYLLLFYFYAFIIGPNWSTASGPPSPDDHFEKVESGPTGSTSQSQNSLSRNSHWTDSMSREEALITERTALKVAIRDLKHGIQLNKAKIRKEMYNIVTRPSKSRIKLLNEQIKDYKRYIEENEARLDIIAQELLSFIQNEKIQSNEIQGNEIRESRLRIRDQSSDTESPRQRRRQW